MFLKSELCEEPLVLSSLLSLFEKFSDLFSHLSSTTNITDGLLCDNSFQINIQQISCGHEMVVVENFEERFYSNSFGDFSFIH